ncbi:50S ribosomal protein L9 [candidate division KSB1 bacterium]
MKVILRQDYDSLGKIGDIVEVKPGFARNFLLPKSIAMTVSKGNLKTLEAEKRQDLIKVNKEKLAAEKLAEELGKVSLTASVAVGGEDKIFGSVTSQTISDLLKDKGYDIDKKKIILEEPIKALGIYTINIKLYHDVEGKVKVWVVKE